MGQAQKPSFKMFIIIKASGIPATQTGMIWGGQGKIRTPDREKRALEKEIETAAAALFSLTADKINK